MAEPAGGGTCLWCQHQFQLRRGGSRKRFCSAAHRSAFWSAARRWTDHAIAAGVLSLDQLRSDDPAACTLLRTSNAPAPTDPAWRPAREAPAESPGEELLDTLLRHLLDLPGDGWFDLIDMLPAELVENLCEWIERRCEAEPAGG